jgi:hypothetical protein
VGLVEDGKYKTLTEDPQPAAFSAHPAIADERNVPGDTLRP